MKFTALTPKYETVTYPVSYNDNYLLVSNLLMQLFFSGLGKKSTI